MWRWSLFVNMNYKIVFYFILITTFYYRSHHFCPWLKRWTSIVCTVMWYYAYNAQDLADILNVIQSVDAREICLFPTRWQCSYRLLLLWRQMVPVSGLCCTFPACCSDANKCNNMLAAKQSQAGFCQLAGEYTFFPSDIWLPRGPWPVSRPVWLGPYSLGLYSNDW